MQILDADQWWPLVTAHKHGASERTRSRETRMRRGQPDAMEDFLYEYYPVRPQRFAKWYPGVDDDGPIKLRIPHDDPAALAWWEERAAQPWHEVNDDVVALSTDYFAHRSKGLEFQAKLQRSLLNRPASFGCLGWHEWAMVYKEDEAERRHALPLRLGQEETDRIVEGATIRCTHLDAFQFFTPEARPLNAVTPTYETVEAMDQPGCIHASMDLLRVCVQFQPMIPGDLAIAAFDLALRARRVDMAASPYDATAIGIDPIKIETTDGKSEYIRRQQDLAGQARELRLTIAPLLETGMRLARKRADVRPS